MRRFLFFVTFCAFVFAVPSFFKRFSCGFKLAKMHLEAPFCSRWEVTPDLSDGEIHSIHSHTYTS